jgi:cell division septal protein FtsQ
MRTRSGIRNIAPVRRKFGKILLAVLLSSFVSILFYIFITRFFSIQTIEVVGQNIGVIIDKNKIPKNLLFFPTDRIRKEILQSNTLLADIRFQKVYPHTLKIVPVVRAPFARLYADNRMVLVDRTGIVLQDGDDGLPLTLIRVPLKPFRVGVVLNDEKVQFALRVLDFVKPYLTVESITNTDGSSFLVKDSKTDIFITQDKPISETLATLQMLMTGFRIKGTLPTVVDLRFDKPIVKI